MSRRPVQNTRYEEYSRAHAIDLSSSELQSSVAKKGASSKKASFSSARVEEIKREAEAMRLDNNWKRAGAVSMVALWHWCHEQTYGVGPAMTGKEWSMAALAAGALMRREFDGKAEEMVAFLQWTWREEGRNLKWRKENGKPVNPIGWRLQFNPKHVVKWRANGGK